MDANLTDAEREQVLEGNALRVLGLKVKGSGADRDDLPIAMECAIREINLKVLKSILALRCHRHIVI